MDLPSIRMSFKERYAGGQDEGFLTHRQFSPSDFLLKVELFEGEIFNEELI
jgi:hypothetical protein